MWLVPSKLPDTLIARSTSGTTGFTSIGMVTSSPLTYVDVSTRLVGGWGCSSFDERALAVNGQTTSCCGTLLAQSRGADTFSATTGTSGFASIYWWGNGSDCPP